MRFGVESEVVVAACHCTTVLLCWLQGMIFARTMHMHACTFGKGFVLLSSLSWIPLLGCQLQQSACLLFLCHMAFRRRVHLAPSDTLIEAVTHSAT